MYYLGKIATKAFKKILTLLEVWAFVLLCLCFCFDEWTLSVSVFCLHVEECTRCMCWATELEWRLVVSCHGDGSLTQILCKSQCSEPLSHHLSSPLFWCLRQALHDVARSALNLALGCMKWIWSMYAITYMWMSKDNLQGPPSPHYGFLKIYRQIIIRY